MKKTRLFTALLIFPAALLASRIVPLDLAETVKRSPTIVRGVVTSVNTKKDTCSTDTIVNFDVKETLKGDASITKGAYHASVYHFAKGCPEISFMEYANNKTFTKKDIGTEAIFFYCFSPDYSHCSEDLSTRGAVLRLVKKKR